MFKTRSIVRSMTNHLQNKKILIIDDDLGHCEVLGLILEEAGAVVYIANDGQTGLRQLYITQPDLVIVDVMMPVMNGWEVCRQIRLLTDTPIIMLTTLNDDDDIVQGFNSGADDFISKPFNAQILKVRAESLLRRREQSTTKPEQLEYHDDYLSINLAERSLFVKGAPIKLTATEFRLLSYLVRHAGRVLTYNQILENVWGSNYHDSTDYVHVYLSRLRQKIEKNHRQPQYLLTEHGVGYRFNKQ